MRDSTRYAILTLSVIVLTLCAIIGAANERLYQ